ncbi:hypothetical protein ABW20_dc0104956 [Dactylellina cionopaga]|nr:hypothetical protein ABW20_dc0104956 [Dactylellina cionopaga]
MSAISFVPLEILFEVFTHLPLADLARVKRVCKSFHSAAQKVPIRSYTFRVDAVTHPTWKLVRHLLTDPKLAEQITEITVEWTRRDVVDESTWTAQWVWTPEERDTILQLHETMKSKVTSQTMVAILAGVNSEALLPFLLGITSNLETLHIGEILQLFILPNPSEYSQLNTERSTVRVMARVLDLHDAQYEYGETQRDEREKRRREVDKENDRIYGVDPDAELVQYSYEDEEEDDNYFLAMLDRRENMLQDHIPPEDCPLWFHHNLQFNSPGNKWVAGLPSIKRISHGFDARGKLTTHHFPVWRVCHLVPLLFFPRIETIEATRCSEALKPWEDLDSGPNSSFQDILDTFKGMKSAVKRIELLETTLRVADFERIAAVTGALEYVSIEDSEKMPVLGLKACKKVVQAFLGYNEATLTLGTVSINGMTGDEWLLIDSDEELGYY